MLKLCRVLTERGCHHYEIPIIMNLMPETPEEAIKLLPSLNVSKHGAPARGCDTLPVKSKSWVTKIHAPKTPSALI